MPRASVAYGTLRRVALLGLLALLVQLTLCSLCGCRPWARPQVVSVVMCTQVNANDEPLDRQERFAYDTDTLHCSVRVADADGHTVRAVFVAEDAIDVPNYVVETLSATAQGSHAIDFAVARDDRPWPAGSYRVEVYLDGELAQTVPFAVQPPQSTPTYSPMATATATDVPPTPTHTPVPPMRIEVGLARGPQSSLQELDAPAAYAPGAPAFYCLVAIHHAPPDTSLRVRWTALDAMPEPNRVLQEASYTASGSERVAFGLPREGGLWPVGRYCVSVYVDDREACRHEFGVHP